MRQFLNPVCCIKQIHGGLYVSQWSTMLIETFYIEAAKKMSQTEASAMLSQLEADVRFRGMYRIETFTMGVSK